MNYWWVEAGSAPPTNSLSHRLQKANGNPSFDLLLEVGGLKGNFSPLNRTHIIYNSN
jgi:hypothetical protein